MRTSNEKRTSVRSFRWQLVTAFAVAALLILAVYIGFMRLADQAYDRELNIEPVFLLPDYER